MWNPWIPSYPCWNRALKLKDRLQYPMEMGAFIVVEGVDGSGKSTVCRRVVEELRSSGYDAVMTVEPTHDGIGALIRSGSLGPISQVTESLLFTADRHEHTEWINKQVEAGKVVICDRYYASTIAYQSAKLDGDSVDGDRLLSLSEPFIQVPDAVILLDMEPEDSLARVDARGEAESKFERLDFLEQVRGAYLKLADSFGYEVVDASRSKEEVFQDVMTIIQEVL